MLHGRGHALRQGAKWSIYALLIVNFGFYVVEDWSRTAHTIGDGSTFLDWTSEFANTIDESAWFLLLFMFELETYLLSPAALRRVHYAVRGARLLCFVMIAHTVFAYAVEAHEYSAVRPVQGVTDLCDLTGGDISFVYNLKYTQIDDASCAGLSAAGEYFWASGVGVVTDAAGFALEKNLIWVDLIEAVVWLLLVLAIEVSVRLHSRGVIRGALLSASTAIRALLYAILLVVSVYWATLSHWLYVWDEFLWVAAFSTIEMNLWQRRVERERIVPVVA